MQVKFVKLSDKAVEPRIMRPGDAGADLTATSMNETEMYIEYGTDLAVEIPPGYGGFIYPRSSLSNYDLILSNHTGVIDSNFRGEIKFRFKRTKFPKYLSPHAYAVPPEGLTVDEAKLYAVGDRIGQLVIKELPTIEFVEAEELSESNRGDKGYGSSGN